MFIVDFNQVIIASYFVAVGQHTNSDVPISSLRHMTLNTLQSINTRFKNKYGSMVIASDALTNWRKEYFPFYKAARRKTRAKSDIDWKTIFQNMDLIKEEIKENFPYKFLQVDRAEADDIIAVIVKMIRDEDIVIVSGDKDFKQLQKFENVKQWAPAPQEKWIIETEPRQQLLDHILAGDTSDGVPNLLSPDNIFVIEERQKVLTKRRKEEYQLVGNRPDDKYYRNWVRNKTLIDLDCTPQEIKDEIKSKFAEPPRVEDRSKLQNYMMRHGLKNLLEKITNF